MDFETVKAFVASLVRHLLTGTGAYLVGEGVVTNQQWETIVAGGVSIVLGLIWSWWQKRKTVGVKSAA